MSISTKEFATKFTGELDRVLVSKAAVGFMTDNEMKAKFVGAKSVKIPQINMVGLADYNRAKGFVDGVVNVSNTVYTMQQDRARSFSIDREDMDETGIAELAGQIMGEFVRTKVVPETDAYVISKLAGIGISRSQIIEGFDETKPFTIFSKLLKEVQDAVGFDDELVCFVNSYAWSCLRDSDELVKHISVGDFEQGNVSLQVSKIDGVPIIPVSSTTMHSSFSFNNASVSSAAGGFKAESGARGIYMLMMPKKAASLVRKNETVRIFTPEQNIDADAYKFDYRIYYDVFVKTPYLSSVWAVVAPSVTITSDVAAAKTIEQGSDSGNELSVTASASDGAEVSYQWYECDDLYKSNPRKISGANTASYSVDTTQESGEYYYYFVRVSCGSATFVDSNVCECLID